MLSFNVLIFLLFAYGVSGQFSYPLVGKKTWTVGDEHTIRFVTDFEEYSVAIWQQAAAGGSATLGPVVYETSDGSGSNEFDWTVQKYDFNLEASSLFFFWMFEGPPETQGNQSHPQMSSAFFRIAPEDNSEDNDQNDDQDDEQDGDQDGDQGGSQDDEDSGDNTSPTAQPSSTTSDATSTTEESEPTSATGEPTSSDREEQTSPTSDLSSATETESSSKPETTADRDGTEDDSDLNDEDNLTGGDANTDNGQHPSSGSDSDEAKLSTAAIAGIAVGAAVGGIAILVLTFFMARYLRAKQRALERAAEKSQYRRDPPEYFKGPVYQAFPAEVTGSPRGPSEMLA